MSNIDNAKWYVLHTYSGYESLVEDGLKKVIENYNLEDTIFDIRIPKEETIEEKPSGKKKVVERKTLPCYVFIKMIYNNDLWYLLTNIRGVTGFVGPQGRPTALSEEEVKRMRLESKVANADYSVGDLVRICAGPLDNLIGEIISLNESSQKARVKVSMFGRDTEVEFNFVDITKLNDEEAK
ncbi:MAG: transcription termination/antitermination protein NusG [Christensenellaceae bacterium]